MARFTLPQFIAGLSYRIGHDDAVRNAEAELQLAQRRIGDADDLIRRVEGHALPTEPAAVSPTERSAARHAA